VFMATQIQSAEHKREPSRQRAPAKPAAQGPVALAPAPNLALLQRAIADPRAASPRDILALQRLAGNRAVTRLIQSFGKLRVQTKLAVGPAGDKYEQEADRVAEQVVSGQSSHREASLSAVGGRRSAVSRQAEEEEEVQTKPLAASITPLVQRQVEEEEEEVQAKPLVQRQAEEEEVQTKALVQRRTNGGFEAGPEIESRLAALKGGGSPLPGEVRAAMEPPFGADFSGVRVHTGGETDQLNRQLSAQAFTHGQDIYMSAGKYAPGTTAGNRLLAHELTHVVQQSAGRVRRDTGGMTARPARNASEREAAAGSHGEPALPSAAQEQTSETSGHDFGVVHSSLDMSAVIQCTLDQHIRPAQLADDHYPFIEPQHPSDGDKIYFWPRPSEPESRKEINCQNAVALALAADQGVLGRNYEATRKGSGQFLDAWLPFNARLTSISEQTSRIMKLLRRAGDIVYWKRGERGLTEHYGVVMPGAQNVGGYNQHGRVGNTNTGEYNAAPPEISWWRNDDERAVYRP
jgi:hypothetical protein